jgi:tetraacyldisaccharide 4'-kinase
VAHAGSKGQELIPQECIGDEGRLLIRWVPKANLVVSRRRALGARYAVTDLGAEALVLDDAFQYWRLKRDIDLVSLDASCPFGNGSFFPAGILRESPESLSRAHAILLKGTSQAATVALQEVRRFAPNTPAYQMSYRYTGWRDASNGQEFELQEGARMIRSAACGIARPEPFFHAIEALIGSPVPTRAFPDHHTYTLKDLREFEAPTAMTEKDGMNLPPTRKGLPRILLLKGELKVCPLEGALEFPALLTKLIQQRSNPSKT